ncbi:RTA1 like protein-domain-containing protein [Leptodontidium sp. 2 PMI_412]|nr:RTA1 like protein-domain-containing protein [Leptodontidium sp. 2 PMI_412]
MAKYWETHPDSIWLYDPNLPLAIVATVLYAIPMFIQFWQSVFKYKSYYFIVVFLGALLEVGGYAVRTASIKDESSIPLYAVSSSFIVVAPLFVGAGDYLLISRLCLRVLPSHHTHIFKIPVAKLTRIFVICDIVTLLVQVNGSGIAASNNWEGNTVKIGENVMVAGLAMQLATFSFFFLILAKFHLLTRRGVNEEAGRGWRGILVAVYFSSGMIIIRCIFRLAEFSRGIFGYPFTHEWMFYALEAVPMLPAIAVFCVWHPGKYFGASGGRSKRVLTEIPLVSSGSRV